VVVPLAKKQECPPERFLDAAQLAAHFSEARGETIVDVQYTERKYLRKPKGSARGFVIVDREKVIALRVAPAQVQFLVDREEEG
jgi:predicted ribosome quality control (RQC) complex YloA/Tae2 family protein